MLDLQSMVAPGAKSKGPPAGSRASKGCTVPGSPPDNTSTLSVAICAF
jgi:hypothetical protein